MEVVFGKALKFHQENISVGPTDLQTPLIDCLKLYRKIQEK